jgi:phage terminase large subunit-like protein
LTVVLIPELDPTDLYPTLGPQVADFLEATAVFGPGDKRGDDYVVDQEVKALLGRMYEVYPQGHEQEGRRRFKRCAISLRKGSRKTEIGGLVAYAELHPHAPVRCDGFDSYGQPVGVPVNDPYIPMLAYTEEQTEDLAYAVLYVVCTEGPDARWFDAGLERVVRTDGSGKAAAMAGAPQARDGARTTFQHFDETAHLILPRLVKAHQTMLANIPKRPMSDPWSLETSVAPEPGMGSVAEKTWDYAQAIKEGRSTDSRLFFFHREASIPLDKARKSNKKLREWVLDASGPAVAQWTDVGSIIDLINDPTTDLTFVERVWGNRRTQSSQKAFNVEAWASRASDYEPSPGGLIVVGFDGSQTDDSTALVATEVDTGFQWVAGLWEQPFGADHGGWEVPEEEVTDTVDELFDTFRVWRLYGDPPYWRDTIRAWQGTHGTKKVIEWWTNRRKAMAYALKNYSQAMVAEGSQLHHDGNERMKAHIGNAYRRYTNMRDEETGERLFIIGKEGPNSPLKIDAAMAGCLSWEARGDAKAAGATGRRRKVGGFH